MLIPQSVSYASSLANLSPATGLVSSLPQLDTFLTLLSLKFSASIPGIIYSLLGTSHQLNVAPEAALSLLVGQALLDVLHSSPPMDSDEEDKVGIAVATIITAQVRCKSPLTI